MNIKCDEYHTMTPCSYTTLILPDMVILKLYNIARYGKSYIPISKVDASLMQGETEKGLVLICTTKRSNIRKEVSRTHATC